MPKRGRGEGSYYQEPNGSWRGAICFTTPEGRLVRKKFRGETKNEVLQKVREAQHDIAMGKPVLNHKRTLADWLDRWCEHIVKPTNRPMTYTAYRVLIDKHIKPAIGGKVLAKLTADDVRRFLVAKSQETFVRKTARQDQPKTKLLSPRTVKHMRDCLRAALNCAIKDGLLSVNVAAHVSPPRVEAFEAEVWSAPEAERFMAAAAGHRLEALFWLAIATGLRKGELLGLKWDAIDLDNMTLAVRLNVQRVSGAVLIGPPKTAKSRRVIRLPEVLRPILEEHRRKQELERAFAGDKWEEHGWLFPWAGNGRVYDPRSVNRVFDSLIRTAKVKRIRVHDLRHSAATLLLSNRVPVRTVSDILGHSTATVTMQVYAHVLDAMKDEAANAMNGILSPVRNRIAPRTAPTDPTQEGGSLDVVQ